MKMEKVQDSPPPPPPPSSPECPAVKAEMDLEDPGQPTSHHQPLPQPAAADQNNEWLTLVVEKVQDSPPPNPPSSPECPAVKAEMGLEDPGQPTSHHQPLPQPAAADQNNEWLPLIVEKVQDSPPPPPPSSPECPAVKAEMGLEDPGQPTSHHQPLPQPAAAEQNKRLPEINPQWSTLILSFSLAAISIAASVQCQGSNPPHLSISLEVALLSLVFSLATFVVSNFMAPNFGAQAQYLQYAGVFSGITAFFLAITTRSSLWLKVLAWAIYIISAIAIIIYW